MYAKNISTNNPALVVFLIDQSGSMRGNWGGGNDSKAVLAADALNKSLYDLALNACIKDGITADRVHIGAYTYNEGSIAWALGQIGEGHGWAEAQDWVPGYSHVDRIPVSQDGSEVIYQEVPVWITSGASGGTPMHEALTKARDVVARHAAQFPDSYPPIVINITDGRPNGGYGRIKAISNDIRSISTSDGDTLLMNIHISHSQSGSLVFPSLHEATTHPDDAVLPMAECTSLLPANMLVQARKSKMHVKEGSIAMIIDADWSMLTKFLRIGTTLRQDPEELAPVLELPETTSEVVG